MDFKSYIEENWLGSLVSKAWNWIATWMNTIVAQISRSVKQISINGGTPAVKFSIPLTAPIAEGYSGPAKGEVIAGKIADPQWSPQQTKDFSNTVTKKIASTTSYLGLKFEIEVAIYLVNKYQLEVEGGSLQALIAEKSRIDTDLQTAWKSSSVFALGELQKYIAKNASELGDRIYIKSKEILKCTPDTLAFLGKKIQEDDPFEAIAQRDTADLALYCGNKKQGWSVKHVSEPVVTIAQINMPEAYELMTGEDGSELDEKMRNINVEGKQAISAITDIIYEDIVQSGKMNDPQAFADLLSTLISGNSNTLLAVTNYIKKSHTVGASSALEKEFDVRMGKNGMRLQPKEGATVNVKKISDGIKFEYRAPGSKGTNLTARITSRTGRGYVMQFTVNNLSSN